MKPERIPEILKKFEDNTDRAIMIDGRWGIGKTYQLLAHISGQSRKEKRKKKYVYVSMFGKETIDDIHTELYAKMNPGRNTAKKAIRLIPKVAPLITGGVDLVESLQFALKTEANELPQKNQIACVTNEAAEKAGKIASEIGEFQEAVSNKGIKKRRGNKTIVVFDDFERLDFDKISIETLMGYFHTLILQHIKVVVACNEGEILKSDEDKKIEKYKDFREKVFDRRYIITATDEEILRSYWGEDKDLLDDCMTKELQNNLRLSNRAAHFYVEAKSILSRINENYENAIRKKDIMRCCIYIIVGTYTDSYKKYHEEALSKLAKNTQRVIAENYAKVSDKAFSQELSERVGKIQYVACHDNNINNMWLLAFCKLYYFSDENDITDLLEGEESYDMNPLRKEVTFLPQVEKNIWFERQVGYIFETKKINMSQLEGCISRMATYDFLDASLMEKIAQHIVDNKESNEWLKEVVTFPGVHAFRECEEFQKILKQKYEESEFNDYLFKLERAWIDKSFDVVYDYLLNPPWYALKNYPYQKEFKTEVIDFLENNNYLICDLKGGIEKYEWWVTTLMIKIARENGFGEKMQDTIEAVSDNNDPTVRERKRILLSNDY